MNACSNRAVNIKPCPTGPTAHHAFIIPHDRLIGVNEYFDDIFDDHLRGFGGGAEIFRYAPGE